MQEIEGKILQFFMESKFDHDQILLSNPWIFRNSWLVIKPWDRETNIISLDFDHVPIWIQLWGLPNHCKIKQMGEAWVPCWEMWKQWSSMNILGRTES